MSIKTSADEWVRREPTQAIAIVTAVALVLGALVGFGVGFKVEQSRVKSDVKKLQNRINSTVAPKKTGKGLLGQRVGTVTAVSSGKITVKTKKRGLVVVSTTATTTFEKAARGTIADVVSGKRVLVTAGGNEIVVLPAGSKLGRVVSVVASDFIKIANGNGAPAAKIKTPDVHRVETLATAKSADVAVGDNVLAGGVPTGAKAFAATEVIVLPADSGFTG
jgi:hypothetical protein